MLAQIHILHQKWEDGGSEFKFDPEGFKDGKTPKQWDSYENRIEDEPAKSRAKPVTVMSDAAFGLAGIVLVLSDVVNESGRPVPATSPKTYLINLTSDKTATMRFVIDVVEGMRRDIRGPIMARDFDYLSAFQNRYFATFLNKTLADPGAGILARVYVDFLKCVAVHAANAAWEQKSYTLNRGNLFTILRMMGSIPEAGVAEVTLDTCRANIAIFDEETAAKKTKTDPATIAPAKKAAAPPTAKTPAIAATLAAATPAVATPAVATPAVATPAVATPAVAAINYQEVDLDNLLAEMGPG